MFNRHTSDSLNPVFFKIVHQMTTTPIMPLLFLVQVLLVIGFFIGYATTDAHIDTIGNIFLAFYSYSALFQIITFVFKQHSEFREDGLDPSLGTRLTAWQIIRGQYLALLILAFLSLLISLPVFFVIHEALEMPASVYFWAFLGLFGGGACGLSLSSSPSKKKKSTSLPSGLLPLILLLIFGLPLMGNLILFSKEIAAAGVANQVLVLLIALPLLILIISYEYGAWMPLSLERFGLFRKLLLASIVYALPVSLYAAAFIKKEPPLWDNTLTIYRIVILVYALFYLFSACFDEMHPTFRRRLYAQSGYRRQFFTIFWQSGAVPGFITGLVLSVILLLSFIRVEPEKLRFIILSTLAVPLTGLVLLLRHFIGDKLSPSVQILFIVAMLLSVFIFSALPVLELVNNAANHAPWTLLVVNYLTGILLALPAIVAYFKELRPTATLKDS